MSANATMISFACDGCGRPFSVPASYAGRKATCKTCGNRVVVPAASAPFTNATPAHANGSAMPHALVQPPRATMRPAPVDAEDGVPTSDPVVETRRAPRVAVISEAQSAPAAMPRSASNEAKIAQSERRQLLGDMPPAVKQAPAASPKVPMRVRRLMADASEVAKAFTGDGPIRIKSTIGDPPELYQVEFHVKGLQRGWLGKPKKRNVHVVEIQLTSEYPRVSPQCRMLTPVFHPNIDETTICVGDHWTAGERLVDLIVRIGEMLAYQDYNIKSPLNGEAAMWADLHPKRLPVDPRNLRPSEMA